MNTRNTRLRRTAIALACSAMTVSLAACGVVDGIGGSSTKASPTKGDDITVGLLLPEKANTRYEKFDYPIIEQQVAKLTNNKGKVDYANAAQDATKQSQQFQQMVADKVDVILVDAVDSKAIASDVQKAKDAGIPVIAYDRLAQGPIDAYISFDNELVGQVQGKALLEALGTDASSKKIVMMNGSPTDPNAAQFKSGALGELNGKVVISKTYDTKDWDPAVGKANMEKAISAIGLSNIAGVYSANDGLAGAVIDAMKTMGVSKVPPVTGQDAELDAVQRIVRGEQYMSVYKSYPDEASAAAEMAVAKVQGRGIEFDALTRDKVDSPTNKKIPSQLMPVVALTKANIKETVIQDGIYTVKQICTSSTKADCTAIGLK
ncbi:MULTISPECIES: sugar ABC transporter substrate-binding protein [Streptomyces]|uniref:Substrate-binding domain-containing protein n=3 Tax=Streptomyces mirabilis TaxID=68239 RepID=A0ABU3UP94_9ACTN|nr:MULTISPECIES: substrate-binding domain-containing protein [Streptomyces]MCX4610566.1 substrate-binding domain-containing protein [Streptomyces mirabilis]MCX5350780.1 substrate-binding domain-containing protein [Streptomyces mirabilis]MDU8995741.1 substrate-binding domain-containing protein [Streptomyces mirabilis]